MGSILPAYSDEGLDAMYYWVIRNHSTIGERAPTYRYGIEKLMSQCGLENPRILILGAIVEESVLQVMSFTSKYTPSKIILADKSEGVLDRCRELELPIEIVHCDFKERESAKKISEYDIALADRLVNNYIIRSNELRELPRRISLFLENITQSWSRKGGIILCDDMTSGWRMESLVSTSQNSLINKELIKLGLHIDDVGRAMAFREAPNLSTLKEEAYFDVKMDNNFYWIIGKV